MWLFSSMMEDFLVFFFNANTLTGPARVVSKYSDRLLDYNNSLDYINIILYYKKKLHSSSCDIEDFVETHLCKLAVCVILRSRVLRVVCPHLRI